MSLLDEIPPEGTPEYAAWRLGATHEHDLSVEGMSESGKEIYDVVQVLAQNGDSGDYITEFVAHVFTTEWSFKDRARLAWKILRR